MCLFPVALKTVWDGKDSVEDRRDHVEPNGHRVGSYGPIQFLVRPLISTGT